MSIVSFYYMKYKDLLENVNIYQTQTFVDYGTICSWEKCNKCKDAVLNHKCTQLTVAHTVLLE